MEIDASFIPKIDSTMSHFRSLKANTPPYKMAVCAIFRNEQHNLAQWIVYHYLLGVDHFYLLDNDSDDNSLSVLKPFIDMNLVTYLPWNGDFHNMLQKQFEYCSNATEFAPLTQWMGLFEVDEYLVMPGHDFDESIYLSKDLSKEPPNFPLHQYLDDYRRSRCGGVWLDRMDFDSNGHPKRPDGLIMSQFTSRMLSVKYPKAFGKNIVLFEGLDRLSGGHNFNAKDGWSRCFADHTKITSGSLLEVTHHVYEPIRLNHYVTLSHQECLGKIDTLKKRNSEDDWRVMHGKQYCDKNMVGTELYKREEHVQDRTLSDSLYPLVVEKVISRLDNSVLA